MNYNGNVTNTNYNNNNYGGVRPVASKKLWLYWTKVIQEKF